MDYKHTLNLPKTDFLMKADLPKREPVFLESWQKQDIYAAIRRKSKGKPKYILHDGPPYANGNIHIGHALNKALKDIIVKYKTMRGFDSAYVPGWDCHGLPVEHQLFKELKITKYQISQIDFRKKAYAYAMKYVGLQREEFKRLGVFGDWENPYLTLTTDYEEAIIRSFSELVKKGYVYSGRKPVNWCFKCETALAEAEVEYDNHASPSVYVKFKLDDSDTYFAIWTTTPWTLLANVAVAAHPDLTYVYLKTEKGELILSKDLMPGFLEKAGLQKHEVLKEVKGKELEGLVYTHPFGLRKGRLVLADYVSKEEGTGLVHTAPGHGNEDYLTGLKYNLEIIMPVDLKGNFDTTAGEFSGMNVYDANPLIIEKLKSSGALLAEEKITHSYPHCWRCKNPVIFRATKQWFLSMGHNKLRDKLTEAINSVEWVPPSGKERISGMINLRPDWCLSRQRYWGVPIPSLACNSCHEEFLDPGAIEKFIHFVAKEGTDSWFSHGLKDFLKPGLKCPNCGAPEFSKGSDILDVWFDSGVSSQAVLKKRPDLEFPAALYLEGSDQHRGWFQSSLIPAMCIDGIPPFKSVLTHGFVVDGEGRKMSKSLGNVISPFDIIKNSGADILRLWVASSDYNDDIRISAEILQRLSEAYRKVRNTCRFILSNLYDFNPQTDKADYDKLKKLDKWLLARAEKLLHDVTAAYEKFEFHKAYKGIYDFCNEDLSMYYLDMVKGRLYTYTAASAERRAAQTVIYEALNILVKVMAPILPFSAEDIWQCLPKGKEDSAVASVHLADWPKPKPQKEDITQELKLAIELIPAITKALEEKRIAGAIGSSFDAKINLLTNNESHYKVLECLRADLPEMFKVSQVNIVRAANPDIAVEVFKADGEKCERCWNYSPAIVSVAQYGSVCEKCLAACKEAIT